MNIQEIFNRLIKEYIENKTDSDLMVDFENIKNLIKEKANAAADIENLRLIELWKNTDYSQSRDGVIDLTGTLGEKMFDDSLNEIQATDQNGNIIPSQEYNLG